MRCGLIFPLKNHSTLVYTVQGSCAKIAWTGMKAAAQKWSSPFQGTRVMLADKVHGVNRKLETSFLCTVYTEWTERIYIGICVTVHGNKCQRWVGFNTFLEGKNTQIYITLFNPMWTQDSVAKNAYKISLLNIFHINIASNCWATRYLVLNKCMYIWL